MTWTDEQVDKLLDFLGELAVASESFDTFHKFMSFKQSLQDDGGSSTATDQTTVVPIQSTTKDKG